MNQLLIKNTLQYTEFFLPYLSSGTVSKNIHDKWFIELYIGKNDRVERRREYLIQMI